MKTYFNHLYLHIHFLKYFLQTIFRINSFGCCRKSRSRRVYDRFESRCWQNWSSKDWNIDDSPRCLFSGKLCFFGCFPSRCRKIRVKCLLIFLLQLSFYTVKFWHATTLICWIFFTGFTLVEKRLKINFLCQNPYYLLCVDIE